MGDRVKNGLGAHIRNNAIGYLALFVALSGSAYAAGLANNSVKSRHIVNGQVKSPDVKNNGLTGVDIDENTLNLPAADTGAQILAKLLDVDGPESALEADLIDGLDTYTTTFVSQVEIDGFHNHSHDCQDDDLVITGTATIESEAYEGQLELSGYTIRHSDLLLQVYNNGGKPDGEVRITLLCLGPA